MMIKIAFLLTICAVSSKFSSSGFNPHGEYVWDDASRFHALAGEDSSNGNVPRDIDHAYYETSFTAPDWIDISQTGIQADCSFVDDNPVDVIELPFLFPFYGHDHNVLYVSANGFASTVAIECEGFCNWHAEEGDSWYPRYIAPFMTDLDPSPSTESKVMYKFETSEVGRPESFIVSWINIGLWNHTEETFSFQAIMKKSGDIKFNYKNLPFNPAAVTQQSVLTSYPFVIGLEDALFSRVPGTNRWTMMEIRPLDILWDDIKVNNNSLGGNSVVFTALESCLDFFTCESCDSVGKKTGLNCAWCPYEGQCVDRDGRSGNDVTDECYLRDEAISNALSCDDPLPGRDQGEETGGGSNGGSTPVTENSDDTQMFLAVLIVGVVVILLAVGIVCFWLNSKLKLLRRDQFTRLDDPAAARQNRGTLPPLETDTAV